MELRLLVTFEKVATVLSFTRAATELAYAQSSVTSQIRALESSLGTELFDRLGSRIRLTEAGERLLPYARQIIELTDEARAAVVGAEEPSGTLTIGTMESSPRTGSCRSSSSSTTAIPGCGCRCARPSATRPARRCARARTTSAF